MKIVKISENNKLQKMSVLTNCNHFIIPLYGTVFNLWMLYTLRCEGEAST
jgi:hypothetical protein